MRSVGGPAQVQDEKARVQTSLESAQGRKEALPHMAPEAILEHALRWGPVAGFRRITVSQGASIGVEPDMRSRAL